MGITKKRTNTKTDKKTKCTNNLYIKKKDERKKKSKKLMQSYITHLFLSVRATTNIRRFMHFITYKAKEKSKHWTRERRFHFQTSLTIYTYIYRRPFPAMPTRVDDYSHFL